MVRKTLDNLRGGFTLIEAMVVVAVIGILLGVLLPALQGFREHARDIQCQSNLKSVTMALLGYAQQNRGSFPYGFHWARTNKPQGKTLNDWQQASGNNREFVSWASEVSKYSKLGRTPEVESDAANYSSVLQCPQALDAKQHYVSYAMNMVVGVDPLLELAMSSPPRARLRPARLSEIRNQTALVWDTAVIVNSSFDIDFIIGRDIDGQRFWKGAATPQFRYYTSKDLLAGIPQGKLGQNQPIQLSASLEPFRNIDPSLDLRDPQADTAPYHGNLRFRHAGETACNVGFADGSVGRFVAVPRPDKTIQSHNALRHNFMIHWPAGVPADPAYPQ